MADIFSALSWYLVTTLIGVSALPLALRLFSKLPGRGFTLARPLGLLIWAFLFWLLNSIGVLQNDLGGELVALLMLIGVSLWSLRGIGWRSQLDQLRKSRHTVLAGEMVFLVMFILWVWVRGMNPEVAYTEKPMELAFINSILRSAQFPPQDPWLSGYAISYYYFGYVMIAMLTRITGVISSLAFNLSSALWFALTAAALYGIVYDISALWSKRKDLEVERYSRKAGLLGPLFVLLVSTVEGVLEFLHAGGVFWKTTADGALTSKFWSWLGILDLNQAPLMPFDWIPARASGWLWWRGSRVIQDMTLGGANIEVIDEFPFFTYLLSDLHPHLLGMPFVLLVIALSLNLFNSGDGFPARNRRFLDHLKDGTFWLSALLLGSLAFINTWDFPIYVGLFCLTWAYRRYRAEGWHAGILWDFLKNGIMLGLAGFLLYLPFFLGFGSQAGGILPSLEFMTRGVHFWVLFASLLVPIIAISIFLFRQEFDRKSFGSSLKIVVILITALFAVSLLYGGFILSLRQLGPDLMASANPTLATLGEKMSLAGSAFAGLHGNYATGELLRQALWRRISMPGTWLTLGLLLVLALTVLLNRPHSAQNGDVEVNEGGQPGSISVEGFLLILVVFGALLTLFPEYFYLRDQFGWRMNTIFKFYFQAWILWGIAAAAGSAILFRALAGWRAAVFRVAWVVSLIAGLTYPAIMLADKTNGFSMKEWTLDGNAYFEKYHAGDYAAISWLQHAPLGVITEAVGGSYTEYARVSTRSGQPTVLGWPGHESQWRGGGDEMGSRYGDIELLYETRHWDEANRILGMYNVRYVYVGGLERSTYQVNTEKFDQMLNIVYQNGEVTIYEVPGVEGADIP
jgi:YYY domain-containing protein